jgi:hypothetical protein
MTKEARLVHASRDVLPTAQPQPLDERMQHNDLAEPGLSVGAEELGVRFMVEATEQRNFESSEEAAVDELGITDGSPSDEPLDNATFDASRDIWEATVSLATERGELDGAVMLSAVPDDDDPADEEDDNDEAVRPVVLTDSVMRQASLFDQVSDADSELHTPRTDTDDVGHHGRGTRFRRPG